MFNEDTLYQDIVEKWGLSGAHADVYRRLLTELEEARSELARLTICRCHVCRKAIAWEKSRD